VYARGAAFTSQSQTFGNVTPGEVVTIHDSQYPHVDGASGWAGVYNFVNASGYINGSYSGFCIDINQDIFTGTTTTFNVADLAGVEGVGWGAAEMGGRRDRPCA